MYVAGDFRISEHSSNQMSMYTAIRGNWLPDVEQQLRNVITKIIDSERQFWNDFSDSFYLVTVIPWHNHGYGGTGLTNSFCMFMNEKQIINPGVIWTISHETFHHWFGGKISVDDTIKWLHEGFADYYGMQIPLRSGLISFQEYIDLYNNILNSYYVSRAKNMPNNKICDKFWCDYEVQKLPYQRGNLLAHNWNTQIQKATNNTASLDNAMRDIFKKAQEKQKLTVSLFESIMHSYHITSIKDDIKEYIIDGQTIEPDKEAFGNQCDLIWTQGQNNTKALIPRYKHCNSSDH